MEHAIQSQLVALLTKNNSLSVRQSGFQKKHSTETATVHFVDHITEQMDRQRITGSIFIDHHSLLHNLDRYGIRRKSLKWFEDYLTTRTQKVKYNQDVSSWLWGPPRIHTGPDTVCDIHQ